MAKTTYKEQIVALRLAEPDLTYREIADRIGCHYGTVSQVCFMGGMQSGPRGPASFGDVLKLGYAARRAGLTLDQIEGMAR